MIVGMLVLLGVLAARVEAAPRAGAGWWSWYTDPADDVELARDANATADLPTEAEVGARDEIAVGPGLEPVATLPASTADPMTASPSDARLRRRSRWGAVDVTVLARREWTLPRAGTPAVWNALWLVATWRH